MKEYLVIFAQLLCVGWLLRTLSRARGRLNEEQLGWFDIREGSKPPKASRTSKPPQPPKSAKPPPATDAASAGSRPQQGKGPHA